MTEREAMQRLLHGEMPEEVPQWLMSFSNVELARRLTPDSMHYDGMGEYPERDAYPFVAMGPQRIEKEIAFNRHIGRCAFPVGWGANAAFGHGGPGEFNKRLVEQRANGWIYEYETGVRREVRFSPHYVHIINLPVKTPDDLATLRLPDPADPKRYEGFAEDVARAKSLGQWTVGWVNGFFSGVHYFLREYQAFFMDLAAEPEFARRMIATVGEWNLEAARQLCKAGADCIGLCDDLGSEKSMLISPGMYREFIWPWHKRLCDVVHESGAVVHLHSHGAVLPIVALLAEAGFDLLNPLDPDDRMPLAEVRAAAGPRMVLCGGMDKHFWDWPADRQQTFLMEVVACGRRQGPYLLMDSAGVPDSVTRKQFDHFLDISRIARRQ